MFTGALPDEMSDSESDNEVPSGGNDADEPVDTDNLQQYNPNVTFKDLVSISTVYPTRNNSEELTDYVTSTEIIFKNHVNFPFQGYYNKSCFFVLQGVVDVLCEACESLKWKHPSKIQREAIPLALKGM